MRWHERSAQVTWQGDLMSGSGEIHEAPSGAFGPLQVTWASRAEDDHGGKTSPEELIAAAHAACFAMALSHGLAQAGNAPERLETSATVTFVPGTGITKSALTVVGNVPGIDEAVVPGRRRGGEGRLPGLGRAQGQRRADPRRAFGSRMRAWQPERPSSSSLDELERNYRETQERLSDPAVYNDHREAAEVGRRLKELETPYKLAERWRVGRRRSRRGALGSGARGDGARVRSRRSSASRRSCKLALVETDPADEKDVIVEVRQGVGGDEAALWAAEVTRMLQRYAERRGFKTETLSTSESEGGGIKETVFAVKGDGAYSVFKWEGGHAPRPARARRPSRRDASTRRPRRSP